MPIHLRMAAIRPINFLLAVAAICATLLAMAPTPSSQASSTTNATLSARLATTTSVATSGCLSTTGASRFGTVQPNSPAVTGTDCTISFGASSRTSYLRLAQGDRSGAAMTRVADGTLDDTWDGDGMAYDDVSVGDAEVPAGGFWDSAGRLVTVTRVSPAGGDDIVISRYDSSGTLDPLFATAGRSTIDLGEDEAPAGFIVNDDGTFWVYGSKGVGVATDQLIAKIDTDGSLDESFDGDGWKTIGDASEEFIGEVTRHPNGGYLAGLARKVGINYTGHLVRLTDEFDIDTSWNGGTGVFDIPGEYATSCSGLIITKNGGSMCAGSVEQSDGSSRGVVVKRLSDGRPDSSFGGGDGIVEINEPGATSTGFTSITEQDDGTYLVAGSVALAPLTTTAYLARLNSDGTLDTSFGGDGASTVELGGDYDNLSVAERLDDGGYALVGATNATASKGAAVFARLRADLSLDTSFDGDGLKLIDIATPYTLTYLSALGGDEERLGIMGTASNGGPSESAIAIFANDSTPDYDFNNSDWNDGDGTFGVCLRAVGGGAAATWNPHATCPAIDGNYWNGVPRQPSTVAENSTLGANTGSASLRFGFRPKADQVPGQYSANLEFMVVAPEVDGPAPP